MNELTPETAVIVAALRYWLTRPDPWGDEYSVIAEAATPPLTREQIDALATAIAQGEERKVVIEVRDGVPVAVSQPQAFAVEIRTASITV